MPPVPPRKFVPSNLHIEFLDQVPTNQPELFGGKAVNLARLHQLGISIPKGFALSTQCFIQFQSSYQNLESYKILHTKLTDFETLLHSSEEFQNQAKEFDLPESVAKEIISKFEQLEETCENIHAGYAVRSSATTEDVNEFSFAGQADSFLCVKDLSGILEAVKRTWLSLNSARALIYLKSKGINPHHVHMGVIVQEMVVGEVSGTMFTTNVVNNNPDQLIIDSTWGLGESIVAGKVIPDSFFLQKAPLKILKRHLGEKALYSAPHPADRPECTLFFETPLQKREIFSIADEKLYELARLGLQIETAMNLPQDIEWTLKEDSFIILQTRPITTL
ncbi:MAG: PEP/pyruvate-binding domain-containing protein [Candidatus Thorarchaeota archaeon]